MQTQRSVHLPQHLDQLIQSLKEKHFQLIKAQEVLADKRALPSLYYSRKKLKVCANTLADHQEVNADPEQVSQQLIQQSLFFQQEAEKIERPFIQYNQLYGQFDFIKIHMIAAQKAAACEFYLAVQVELKTSKDKKSLLASALPVCEIFSDYIKISYNELEGLVYSIVPDAKYDSLDGVLQSFAGRMKKVRQIKTGIGSVALQKLIEGKIKSAVNFLEEQVEAVIKANPTTLKDGVLFVKKGSDSTFSQSVSLLLKKNQLQSLLDECANQVDSYTPDKIILSQRLKMFEKGLFVSELKNADKAILTANALSSIFNRAHYELEEKSRAEHQALLDEMDDFFDEVAETQTLLVAATAELRKNINQDSLDVRQAALQHFSSVWGVAKQIKVSQRRKLCNEKIDVLQSRYDAVQTIKDKAYLEEKLNKCELSLSQSLTKTNKFVAEKAEDLANLAKESLHAEVINLLTQAIFANLHFWSTQIYWGKSEYELANVKVPNGIAAAGDILLNSRFTLATKIKEIVEIFEKRKSAGATRFLFFTVRSEATTDLYQASQYINNVHNLTQQNVTDFRKALARIRDANGKLKFTSPTPSLQIATTPQRTHYYRPL